MGLSKWMGVMPDAIFAGLVVDGFYLVAFITGSLHLAAASDGVLVRSVRDSGSKAVTNK